jgi:uncharacterized membrane protein YciS (DUF1049 family)
MWYTIIAVAIAITFFLSVTFYVNNGEELDLEDVAGGAVISALIGTFWPVSIALALGALFLLGVTNLLNMIIRMRKIKKEIKQVARKHIEITKRIDEMNKEIKNAENNR